MYESKFCDMCGYFEVPHDSLAWFMVWTCWSILIYNQQMCFISWSTNFVIAKRMTQWPLKKSCTISHNIWFLVKRKATHAVLHNTAHHSELIKKVEVKTWNTIQTLPTSGKNIFYSLAAWPFGHLLTSIFIIKNYWCLFECAIIKNKQRK